MARKIADHLQALGWTVTTLWISVHRDIIRNEIADKSASDGTAENLHQCSHLYLHKKRYLKPCQNER
jgi:hypothetical protein